MIDLKQQEKLVNDVLNQYKAYKDFSKKLKVHFKETIFELIEKNQNLQKP